MSINCGSIKKTLLAKCDFQSNSIVEKNKVYFIDLYWILKNSIY